MSHCPGNPGSQHPACSTNEYFGSEVTACAAGQRGSLSIPSRGKASSTAGLLTPSAFILLLVIAECLNQAFQYLERSITQAHLRNFPLTLKKLEVASGVAWGHQTNADVTPITALLLKVRLRCGRPGVSPPGSLIDLSPRTRGGSHNGDPSFFQRFRR